ncbi:hypothetical protein B0T21DRAFT_415311 [Apiosordaria backusii]|uniref:Uncharacterized protein n=1 Tax=Apiosordaria backusii TaxID=314023 RepID=A0AA40AIW7_9PEZI|nr:hypothetical protein B0T21DRAFT_415311 [Apiosordaria backusii]
MYEHAYALKNKALQAHKRPHSDDDITLEQVKRLKGIWKTDEKPTTLKGIANDLPASLKPLLIARLGPQSLAQSLKKKMTTIGRALHDECYDWKKTGTNNNTIASAMVRFIKPIREISEIDHPDALGEAYKLVFVAKNLWYNSDGGYDEDTQYEDKQIDQLLLEIINKKREAGHRWKWADDVKDLDAQAEDRAAHGIEPWYAESRKALKELVDGDNSGANKEGLRSEGPRKMIERSGQSCETSSLDPRCPARN